MTSSEPTAEEEVFTDDFKNLMLTFCDYDDKRIKLKTELSVIQKKMNELERQIVVYMEIKGMPIIDTGDKGLFKRRTTKRVGNLNKQLLVDALASCGQLKDPEKAGEIVNLIYSSRPVKQVTSLTRKTT